ncbi:MAG: hypothetical protein ACM3ZV_11875 [Bacillota bacterium]
MRELLPPLFKLELVLRDDFAPPLLERPDEDDDLRAPPDELAPEPEDLARDEVDDFFAPPLERDELERDAPPVDLFAVERDPDDDDDLRAPLERELEPELDDPELPPLLDPSVGDHLPDITRCAASATASAMIEPNLVALETTLLAARSAVSAASSPASRIFLRAEGLALIAAAAAARPAASISLLIAAFASLSTVVLLELEREEPERDEPDEPERDEREPEDEDLLREELLRVDLAIVLTPSVGGKDTLRPFRFPNDA